MSGVAIRADDGGDARSRGQDGRCDCWEHTLGSNVLGTASPCNGIFPLCHSSPYYAEPNQRRPGRLGRAKVVLTSFFGWNSSMSCASPISSG
jgi:hypothetical protein